MADVIKLDDGGRVDRGSQKILMALNPSDWTNTGALRKVGELSQNSQVLYRVEEHLIPAGLVEEQKRRTEQDTRQFRLTRSGELWLDEHHADLIVPATRAETQEMASQAAEEASSAKESVQSYRKKVHRLKNDVNDALDEVEEDFQRHHSRLSNVEGRSHSNKRDVSDVSESVAGVSDRVDALEQHHEESVNRLGSRLSEQSSEIEELRDANEELREEIEELREQVIVSRLRVLMEAMWEEIDRAVIQRILDYFQGKR